MKDSMAWIFGGVAIIAISVLLIADWLPAAGLFYNLLNGHIIRESYNTASLPVKWPVMAGVLCILWGGYLRMRNSN